MDIKTFMEEFTWNVELGMKLDIQAFLKGNDNVLEYDLEVDREEIIFVNIKLKKFTPILAKDIFYRFIRFIGYDYLNLYIREEMQGQIKYSYITALSDRQGTRIEVCIK